jgi:ribosomal-protein-alanine N-acetyltransferase
LFFTELETARMLLKNISVEDRDFIYAQFSDDEVNRYLFDEEPVQTIAEADDIIGGFTGPEPRDRHRWVLVRKDDGAKMGTCGFHFWKEAEGTAEVGYDLFPDFWGHGYMTEAMQAAIRFAAEHMHLRRIDAEIYPDNLKSVALAEKLGFQFCGQTQTLVFRGEPYVHRIYSLDIVRNG